MLLASPSSSRWPLYGVEPEPEAQVYGACAACQSAGADVPPRNAAMSAPLTL